MTQAGEMSRVMNAVRRHAGGWPILAACLLMAAPAALAQPGPDNTMAVPESTPLPLPAGPGPTRSYESFPVAVIGGLDKITARTVTMTVPVDQTVWLGRLAITVRACRKAPPIDPPESAAFLQIDESGESRAPAITPIRRFTGWMFASSPAVSAMDHAVYDVWVIDCRKNSTNAGSSTPAR
jgi:hypothetical protein